MITVKNIFHPPTAKQVENDFRVVWSLKCFLIWAMMMFAVLRLAFAGNQQEGVKQIFDMSLSELMNLEITTAGKKAEKISEIPASVIIITRDDIRRYGYQSLEEVLENVPGIYKHDDYNLEGPNFGVRGFWTNQYNKNIILMVNGVSQREDNFGWNWISMINIPVEAIDRVEVVRGPMSVIYGNGAFFGAINIITNEISKDKNGNIVSALVGTESTHRLFARASGQENDLVYAINASYYDTEGRDVPFSKMVTSVATFDGLLTENATTKEMFNTDTRYFNFYGRLNDFYAIASYDECKKHFTAFAPPLVGVDSPHINNIFARVALGYKRGLSQTISVETRIDYRRMDNYINMPHFFPGHSFGMEFDPVSSYSAELNMFYTPSSDLDITMGLNYHSAYNMFIYVDQPELDLYNWRHSAEEPIVTYVAYTQVKYRLNTKLMLVGGLRLDQQLEYEMARKWFDDEGNFQEVRNSYQEDDIIIIPRFAAIYTHNDKNSFKLLYGQAISRPSFFENHQPFGVYHPPLKHQDIQTFELNYVSIPSLKLTFNSSLFYNKLDRLIMRSIEWRDNNYLSFQDNIGEMDTIGAEFQILLKLLDNLKLDFAVSYQNTRDKTNDIDAAYCPNILGYIKTSYEINDEIILSLTGNYVDKIEPAWDPSPQDTSVPNSPPIGRIGETTDSYTNLGANLRFEDILADGFYFNIKFSNILDEDIYYPATTNNAWFSKGTLDSGINASATIGYIF